MKSKNFKLIVNIIWRERERECIIIFQNDAKRSKPSSFLIVGSGVGLVDSGVISVVVTVGVQVWSLFLERGLNENELLIGRFIILIN